MHASLLQITTHLIAGCAAVFVVVTVALLFSRKVVSSSIRLGASECRLLQQELGLQVVRWLADLDMQPFVGVLLVSVGGACVGAAAWLLASAAFFPHLHGFLATFSAMAACSMVASLWAILGMKIGKTPAYLSGLIASTQDSRDMQTGEFAAAFRAFNESVTQAFSFPSFWLAVALVAGCAGVASTDDTVKIFSRVLLASDALLFLRGFYSMCPACHTLFGMFCKDTVRTHLGQQMVSEHRMRPIMNKDFTLAGWVPSIEQRVRERFRWTYTYVCRRCGHATIKEDG